MRSRELAFRIGLIFIPFVVLLFLEGAARLAGISLGYPLFVSVEGHEEYRTINPDVGRRYFSISERPPTMMADYFRAVKTDSTLRIVVQGGSTAAGFPFYYGGTFPSILETRLKATAPEMDVEVINVSMAAVNSYTLVDLAEEIVEIQPDAVLIYAGHNEFFGALGVGSTEAIPGGPWLVRLYLRLQRFRLVRLLKSWIGALAPAPDAREGRMAVLARDRFIEYESPQFHRGVKQFRGNMTRLLRHYWKAGIPVYISTVASNLRDQPPLASSESDGLTSAQAYFDAGQRQFAAGRRDEAFLAFMNAKERDALRFRAPEAVNATIRELAHKHRATLIDGYELLADSAVSGIIGLDLMTDHLHPTARGYAILADAFYRQLCSDGFVDRIIPFDYDHLLLTRIDSLVGAYHIADLRSRWPFSDVGTAEVRIAGETPADSLGRRLDPVEQMARAVYLGQMPWGEANSRLIGYYESVGATTLALRAARSRIQELPHLFSSYVPAARLHARMGRYRHAAEILMEGLEADEQPRGRQMLSDLYRAMKHMDAGPRVSQAPP